MLEQALPCPDSERILPLEIVGNNTLYSIQMSDLCSNFTTQQILRHPLLYIVLLCFHNTHSLVSAMQDKFKMTMSLDKITTQINFNLNLNFAIEEEAHADNNEGNSMKAFDNHSRRY